VPCSCALLGGFAIGAYSADAKCQRVLVVTLCLVVRLQWTFGMIPTPYVDHCCECKKMQGYLSQIHLQLIYTDLWIK